MSIKRQLKSGYQGYFVTVVLEQTVHSVGLGFTDTLHRYVVAKDEKRAEQIAADFYQEQKLEVRISQAVRSVMNVLSNSFPEQVLGFDEGTVAC